jgi:probable HAF family extracellular repeat protein
VIWQNGAIQDLGTLPDGGYESVGISANNKGDVVGFGLNTIADPFSLAGPGFFPTQTRAFLWQNGAMRDLGTLGGHDAAAFFVNNHGQITGQSYTNTTPNPTTGLPTADSFFWENGQMLDIDSLGGTMGFPAALNSRGQLVGNSNLAGDASSHPYLWSKTKGLEDLGTLGGDNGVVNWINNAGDIAGKADLAGPQPQNHDAVLWRKNGAMMIDLGVLPGDACANAYYVNDPGQVVGTSENSEPCRVPTGQHAFLWESGGPMVDLNSLIAPSSSLEITFAFSINDHGEIVGTGVPSGCAPENIEFCGHAYVLIPCDQNHPGVEGCDYSMTDAIDRIPEIPARPEAAPSQPAPAVRSTTTTPVISSFTARVCAIFIVCGGGVKLILTATVTSVAPIADVQFFTNGRLYRTLTHGPFQVSVAPNTPQEFFKVTATDVDGRTASKSITCVRLKCSP